MKTRPYLFKLLSEPPLDVFLCGPERTYVHGDIRTKVKKFLTQKAMVNCFLGEEIEDIRIGKDNHLKIESEHARNSDVIIVFLGSPGTFAELGAFTLDPIIRERLVVFNDKEYQNKKSFVNDGPLKWLKEYQVIWYKPARELEEQVYHCLDYFLLRIRHRILQASAPKPFEIFGNYLLYVTLRIYGECDYKSLEQSSGLTPHEVRNSLADLINHKFVRKVGKVFVCSKVKSPNVDGFFNYNKISSLRAENLADTY